MNFGLRGLCFVAFYEYFADFFHLRVGYTLAHKPGFCAFGFGIARIVVKLAPPLFEFGGKIVYSRALRGEIGEQIVASNIVVACSRTP